ncbi:MAG: KH domain-containing protein [[Clostridium] leptum]
MVRSVGEAVVSGVDAGVLVAGPRRVIREEESRRRPAALLQKRKSLSLTGGPGRSTRSTPLEDKSRAAPPDHRMPGAKRRTLPRWCRSSALTGEGVERAPVDELMTLAMPGAHFLPGRRGEQTSRNRCWRREIIREKLLRLLDKEVPHGVAVSIEKMKERENGIIDIDATIFCERDTHKGIIIGKGGAMLKRVGTYARADMEQFFGGKINLKLWVKVKEDWRNREGLLRNFGYSQSDFDQ